MNYGKKDKFLLRHSPIQGSTVWSVFTVIGKGTDKLPTFLVIEDQSQM